MSHKSFKLLFPLIAVIFLSLSQSQAAVTINVSAEKLKDPGGLDMAVEGVLVLVADANRNGFAGAGDTSFVMEDDVMVAKWDIATGGGNTPGAFSGTTGSVSFSGDWDAGDPLAIYWFPSLTSADVSPGAAVPYGMFRIMSENYTLHGTMDPEQATTNADNVGSGTGTISGSYDSTTNTLNYSLAFQDLTSEITNMHFHVGAVGVPGGVDLGIPSPWVSPKEGVDIVLTDEQEANLLAGNWYVNVHTNDFGAGEIRGQVIVIEDLGGEGPNGTDAWATPLDGTIGHNLRFLTTDATILSSDGESDPSEGEATNFTPGDGPAAPSDVAGQADGPGKITVTWNSNNETEAGYRIERRKGTDGPWVIAGNVAAGVTMFDDTSGIESATAYYYRVVAIRDASWSSYSPESSEVMSASAGSRFANLSNRALVGVDNDILIGSMQIVGDPLRIYAKVAGPTLPAAITNPLLDPELELIALNNPADDTDNVSIAVNDNWKDGDQALIESTTIPPQNDNEPALVATLDPGFYSVVVRGVGETTGFATIELYEFRDDSENHGRIANLSNRAFVGINNDILIGSMQIVGNSTRRIYAKVAGPTLPAAITNPLLDPELELIALNNPADDTDNVSIAVNDNWKDGDQALIESTTIPPQHDDEPALVATLEPGFYSVVVRGVGESTGFATVELYDFPE